VDERRVSRVRLFLRSEKRGRAATIITFEQHMLSDAPSTPNIADYTAHTFEPAADVQ